MFLKTLADLRGTLALRLTLWYAGVFAASSAIAFSGVFLVIFSIVQQRTDEDLEDDIMEECDRLLEIINTTLDIAEAESGAAILKPEDLDLVEMVDDACEVFQTVAEDKDITITTDLPASCRLTADRQRLQRVVANLFDNALKYTATGGRVTITVLDDDPQVRLSVRDTGVGIAAGDVSHIFERFYRCDRSRSERGNGLGLSLALAFVRAHGGEISVSSVPGVGSTFTVTLVHGRCGQPRRSLRPSALPSTSPQRAVENPAE